jgi:CubicO group peptidase (beta-lactamase class C family)
MHKTTHRRLCRSALFAMCLSAVLVQGGAAVGAKGKSEFSAVLSLTSGRSVVVEMKNGKIQSELGRKADASTYFSLASVSKTLTAALVIKLAEQKKINLDSPMRTYLPEVFSPSTIDVLGAQSVWAFLNHATGMASHNFKAVTSGKTSYQQYAELAATLTPSAPVGRYLYSNDNYVLLTLLIEKVTKLKFESAAWRLVWQPLGVPGGYLNTTTRATQVLGGSGAWMSSARDIAVLFNALNPQTPGKKVLSSTWLQKMHESRYSSEYRNGLRYLKGRWGHTGSLSRARTAVVVGNGGSVYVVLSEGATPQSSDKLFNSLAAIDSRRKDK